MQPSETPEPPEDEVLLSGGRANAGRVVRIGDQVARPTYPQTPTVDLFLDHLAEAGVNFAPRPLGFDAQGRHRLRFIEGTVAKPPYPPWALDDDLLIDVARHQRKLHVAAATFEAPSDAIWATSAGDYFPDGADGDLVCHNDLGMSNTVVDVRARTVTGFIDFDYCRPVDRLFDIAVAARHWVPFGDLDLASDTRVDRVRRFELFCGVHGLYQDQRRQVVQLAIAFLERARKNIRALAEGGAVGFQQLLANGYETVNRSTVAWLIDNTDKLTQAN